MSITIKDIATVAGVSYSTVSKALNNSPLVKAETKRTIVKIAEDMGYEPNFAAQRLVSKNTKIIGLIWPTIERTVLAALVTNISNQMAETPYSMILSVDPIQKSIDTFRKFQVDGLILFEEDLQTNINPGSTPLISYGVSDHKPYPYPIIDANHGQAMDQAIEYLARLGHQRITYIGNLSATDPLQMKKYEGFKTAMEKHDLAFRKENIVDTRGLDWYDGYTAMNQLIQNHTLPTAIVGGSYDISSGILRCLREHQVIIPEDLSVISYDNIPQMANLEIPLTCIGVSVEQLAKQIVDSIITRIETDKLDAEVIKMTPTLVKRASCAQVKR